MPSVSPLNSEPHLLSTADLASRWHVSVGHLANLRSAGTGVNYLKMGSRVLYRLSDVEAHEATCEVVVVPSRLLAA